MRGLSFILLAPVLSNAFQLPFKVPFLQNKLEDEADPAGTPKIAIIGAGAGGSSASFWISKAQERFGLDVEVDVYERSPYIGGRSTTIQPYDDPSLAPLELGASIFVKANKNMWRASEEFNLTRSTFVGEDYEVGIWDGESIRITVDGGWWDTLKAIWRYGIISPRRTDSIVQGVVKSYLKLYSSHSPRWDNITDLSATLGWSDATSQTASEYFSARGVSKQYINEYIEASTRVNYGQNVDTIHALEGAASLASEGATSIKGGNYQVFEQFLARSKANVYLNTTVESITPKSATSDYWTVKSSKGTDTYKAVIIAAPYHLSGIKLPETLSSQLPEQPYVRLHVTMLTTKAPFIKSEYLNLPASTSAPRFILTTFDGARNGGKEPEFNSLSYHGLVREGEWAVKIFSKETISDEWLEDVFGEGQVGWVYRKEWDAYPKLPPTSSFPPVRIEKGLYYVNSFEPFISTMETETISSRNVVDLLLNEEFGSSICGPRISASDAEGATFREAYFNFEKEEKFVFGWDC